MPGWWDIVDRALQVQRDTFGEPVVVFFADAPPEGLVVTGIFETPAVTADLGLQRELSDQSPWVAFRVRDLPGAVRPRQGDRVTIRDVDWEITDLYENDASGHIRCRLFRAGTWAPVPLPELAEAVEPDPVEPDPFL